MSGIEVKEAELNALADQALADFAAREGISIPGEAPAPAPRSLGATETEAEPGQLKCPHLPAAPAWANELALAYESGAHGQFILYGNVHDRVAVGGRLINLAGYLENDLLPASRSCSPTTWATASASSAAASWSRNGAART